MNILVTGGAGFIGSHLCRALVRRGDYVICIDNLLTSSKLNISELLPWNNFEFIRHDIIDPLKLEVDQIYNLACPASPIQYQDNAIKTIKTNVIGTMNMLGLANRVKARLLQASTSEVYGDPTEHPQTEDYYGNANTVGPRACYSADTELLTKSGWKLFSELEYNDEVVTINNEKQLEYHKPIEIINYRYNGEMIEFKNGQCDLLVTPNHKMYVRSSSKDQFNLVPAFEEIPSKWHYATMLKVADYNNKDVQWFEFEYDQSVMRNTKFPFVEKVKMDNWLEFIGYYITEGSSDLNPKKRTINNKEYTTNNYRITISQDNDGNADNCKKIEQCLNRLPWNYCYTGHQFVMANKQLFYYLHTLGYCHEKYIPQELLHVSKRQLRILFDAMVLGDAHDGRTKQLRRRINYWTTSSKLAGNFQELLLKLGYAGNICFPDKNQNVKNPRYRINVLALPDRQNTYKTPSYPKRKVKQHCGQVYCVNVPNHIIFVRRNGKALFCGNCYDEGKRVAETLCMDYHRMNNVDIRIARIFNCYGPKMSPDDGRVVSNFIKQAQNNEHITIYGDGKQTRSFCYVDDMVTGLIDLMESDYILPVNLGNPDELSILELANKIIKLTHSKSQIVFKDLPQDDPVRRKPDISLAKKIIGFNPTVSLDEGLLKMMAKTK